MRNKMLCATTLALVGLASVVSAGGQQVAAEVGADGRSIVVRTYRCGSPATLSFTGTAEGLVNGQRRSIPLQVSPASAQGVFNVKRQWPAEGAWVLSFTVAGERSASALVELAPGAELKITSQESVYQKPSARRIDEALRASR